MFLYVILLCKVNISFDLNLSCCLLGGMMKGVEIEDALKSLINGFNGSKALIELIQKRMTDYENEGTVFGKFLGKKHQEISNFIDDLEKFKTTHFS